MTNRSSRFHLLHTGILLGLSLTMVGCTHKFNPPTAAFTGYSAEPKLGIQIGLILTDDFRNVQWEKKKGGDTWVIPVGPNLALNSEGMVRITFNRSVVGRSAAELQNPDLQALLTPRLVFINQTLAASPFGKNYFGLKVEWKLTRPDGRLIWVETVTGSAEGDGAIGEETIQQAIEDLFTNSRQAILQSPEIARMASSL